MTIEQLDAMYKKSYALALAKRNPSAMVAAVSALAKSQRQHTPPINLKNAKIFLDARSIRFEPVAIDAPPYPLNWLTKAFVIASYGDLWARRK